MRKNWKVLLSLALIAAAAFYLYPSLDFYGMSSAERETMKLNSPGEYFDLHGRAITLGLDLQGGIHLVMEVEIEGMTDDEAQDAVARAQEVIRNRVDQFGVAEPTIQRQGVNRIIVELPGLQDVERAKNLIGQTALLEFQLVEPVEDRNRLLQRISGLLAAGSEDSAVEGEAAAMADSAAGKEPVSVFETGAEDAEGLFEEPEEETSEVRELSSLLQGLRDDVVIRVEDVPAVKAHLEDPRAEALIPEDVEFLFSSKSEGVPGQRFQKLFLVRKKPEMTGNMIEDAQVQISQQIENLGQPVVTLSTTDEGVRLFRQITGAHIGERLAIVLDGAVYMAPNLVTKIQTGRAEITGLSNEEEAKDLAIVLRAGALPAKVEVIEDRTVGPSLGKDSIAQGRVAAVISMAIVAVFMLLYYRFAGLVANVALALNILFVFAVLAGFSATLTLPGIAGIILTIGMAVDANVLIFERIREELRSGKTVRSAIDSGYGNALSAIIDANLTTFIVGIVLYEFGTGPIRGFALTLCVGIVSSLFTALIVTRSLFELYTARERVESLSIGPVGVLSNLSIPFIHLRKIAMLVSAAVLALGLVSVAAVNKLTPGIDFAGGTLLELRFEPAVPVEEIRSNLGSVPVGDGTRDYSSSEIKQFGAPENILIRVTESEVGTDVADGIKQVLRSGLGGNIAEADWVRRQEKVGPRIGQELTGAAVRAVIVALALILVYMAWRFKQFLFGIAAVAALAHDVLITLGLLSILDIEITLAVVAAILAIVGYSLNDTIVVFDRIRENLRSGERAAFGDTLNISINECLSRTVITSLTTLIAVAILMIWGGEVIRDFTLTLAVGILVGTYSSVFVASPVLLAGHERSQRRQERSQRRQERSRRQERGGGR